VTEGKPEKQPVSAIKGTHDILPQEARDWQRVEAVTKATFELYGYREIRTPVFEATELFEKSTGETSDIVQKEMYTFTDKGGRSITLRPEYTPSIARAIIEHRLDLLPDPMRYYFIGPMFRFDKPQKGRFRQFHQVDIEVFGENDPAIDAEIIEMADHLLKKLKVTETEVLVNSVGCRKCRPAYLKDLRAAAAAVEASLCPDCKRKAETNPLRIFDCKVDACRVEAQGFPEITGYLDAECAEHFRKFRAYMELYGIPYRVEPRLVRGIDYYTRTTFEITTTKLGAQNALLGGGRYDDMMKDFGGPDISATGFAMGVERLLSVAELEPAPDKFIYVAYLGEEAKNEALLLARFLRSHGLECLLEFKERNLRSQLSRASRLAATWTLIIGEDEVSRGRYKLKNMEAGTQVEAGKQELLEILGRSDR
jgi:histidyl-tRNA synthetase